MKTKKLICVLLSLIFVFSCISVGANATLGLKNNLTVYDKNSGNVAFDKAYAKIGDKLTVLVDGKEDHSLIYEWFIDNKRIENTANNYTPVKSDMQSMISVKIYELPSGELVGNVNMLVSSLPVVYIETEGRQPIIQKETRLNSHLTIQGNDEFNNDAILYNGIAEVKGRGNTTWNDDKKPYKIKLDEKTDILGMGKNKHWVLLSNPYDNTFSRNTLTFKLAEKMGIDYQQIQPVDLVFNGSYVGNYAICEHVRIGDTRVDITDWDDIAEDAAKAIYKGNTDKMTKDQRDELIDIMTDDSKDWVDTDTVTYNSVTYTVSDYYDIPDINGGYLLELDTREPDYISTNGVAMQFNKPEVYSEKMYNEITEYYQAFEDALYSDDYCTIYNGKKIRYNELIDVQSFAKGILINELFMNRDFGTKSTFFYKDIAGKLVYGPVWDMDYTADRTENLFTHNMWYTIRCHWIGRLCSDPYFVNELYKTYLEYRHTAIAELIKENGFIDENYNKIKDSANADEDIWNYNATFDYEYQRVIQWFNRRLDWFDTQFATYEVLYSCIQPYNFKPNKFAANSDLISLSVDENILNITLSTNNIEKISIFNNGKYVADVQPSNSTAKYTDNNIKNSVLTVVGYDVNNNIIGGNFISTQTTAIDLKIKQLPQKLIYNVGDKVDLTGLVLEATYSDATVKNVNPDAVITYAWDAIGAQNFDDYGIVTDTYGEKFYTSLRYQNLKADFEIEVNAEENVQEVEALIDKIPYNSLNEIYYKEIINAALAFEALSEEAKLKVKNKDKLDKALELIDNQAQNTNADIVAYFSQETYQFTTAKGAYVFLIKGNPEKIRFVHNNGNSTITLYNSPSSLLFSIRKFGDYTLWTCLLTQREYEVYAINNGIISSSSFFDLREYATTTHKIISVDNDKFVFENEAVEFKIKTDIKPESIRILENGEVICSQPAIKGENKLSVTPNTLGEHTYSLEYSIDGSWIKIGEYSVYVREKAVNLILGDVSNDRKINSSDALMVLQQATGLVALSENQFKCADVEKDDIINSTDALKILLFSTGNIKNFN